MCHLEYTIDELRLVSDIFGREPAPEELEKIKASVSAREKETSAFDKWCDEGGIKLCNAVFHESMTPDECEATMGRKVRNYICHFHNECVLQHPRSKGLFGTNETIPLK